MQTKPETVPQRYPEAQGTRYLFPCPVLGMGGLYEWGLCDVAQAQRWVRSGPYTNYLSHPFLFEAAEALLELPLSAPVRGVIPAIGYHDDALCIVFAGYEAPWALWRGNRSQIREALDHELVTLGLLRRLA